MTGFEQWISYVGSDRSTNCATTPALNTYSHNLGSKLSDKTIFDFPFTLCVDNKLTQIPI